MDAEFNDEEAFRQIAWESQTLYERAALTEDRSSSPIDSRFRRDFLTAWEDTTGHNRDLFKDVFRALTGIENAKESINRTLGIEIWPREVELPLWITELKRLVAFAASHQPDLRQRSDVPFYHVLDTWIGFALAELRSRIGLCRLSDNALQSVKSWLLDRLREFCLEPLYLEFQTYGLLHNPSRFLGESKSSSDDNDPPTDTYDAFVRKLHTQDGIQSFFTEFPVLARFLMTTIHQWCDALAEFHERLESDWVALCKHTSLPEDAQQIMDLDVLTEDRHHDGRSVIEVTLSEGEAVIYKPRTVQTQKVWSEVVEHTFDMLRLDYESPSIIAEGEEYGWVQEVSHIECEDSSQISRYFERTGVLLGLSYVLLFSDLHFENFVANGEYPVIVDVETILQPATHPLNRDQTLFEEIRESVVWTGYLPVKRLKDRETTTAAGLAIPPFDGARRPGLVWNNVNTDEMNYEEGLMRASDTPKHLPVLSGTMQSPREHIQEILVGFNSVTTVLQRDDISLIPPGIDSNLADLTQRLIFRDTMAYESLLDKITRVESLEDGLELTTSCDELLTNDLIEDHGVILSLYSSEFESLLRLDVPHFTVNSRGEVVDTVGNCTSGLIDQSGYSRVRRHIQPATARKQVEYIQSALSPTTPPQRSVTEDLLRGELQSL